MVLVTGTGRCGTGYIARYLRSCGLDVGHEVLGTDGIAAWTLTVGPMDASRRRAGPEFDVVIHVVREPCGTIASWQTCSTESWDFACANSPTQRSAEPTLRGMQHWYWWNILAEAVADFTIRVEEFDHEALCRVLQLKAKPPQISRRVNSRPHPALSTIQLESTDPWLWKQIREKARGYGYSI